MAQKYTNNELGLLLESLGEKIETGFKGVHDRQDKTNGNVIRNTEYRLRSTGGITTLKWLISTIGVGTIISILMAIF